MINKIIIILALSIVSFSSLYAEDSILYKGYINLSYDSAKNSILGGSTTATAKGYSSILSNPAGLSTNYNIAVYTKTVMGSTTDSDNKEVYVANAADHIAVGALYDSFGVEYKLDDYIVGGGAYGYESKYGLFSIGLSYLVDQTDLSQKDTGSAVQRDEFATGDYITYGLMWQKSFIDLDDYYSVYVGLSHKNSGKYTGAGNPNIVPVSASKTSYGLGFETNVFTTSVLVTLDMSNEYWQSVGETLSGLSYGVKWMMGDKFALGVGLNSQTFSGAILKDIQTAGVGVEFGFWKIHTLAAFTQRTVNDNNGVYLTQQAAHLDLAFAF